MSWHHKYVGNPILSALLRLLFRTDIGDAHCGMRGASSEMSMTRRYVSRDARVCDLRYGLVSDFLRWRGPQISLGVGVDVQVSAAGSRAQRVVVVTLRVGCRLEAASRS